MRYTKRNIEDWDFRDCYPGSPAFDGEAGNFLVLNYAAIAAVSLTRTQLIAELVKYGHGRVEEDGKHVRLNLNADDYLAAFKRTFHRSTPQGRFCRRVTGSEARSRKANIRRPGKSSIRRKLK